MGLEKYKDESLLDYHRRLIYGKLVDHTLSDLDYSELAELVYGQAYSSDVARRMMYGSRKTLEILDSEPLKEFDSEDTKLQEIQKERQRFYDQRREYNKVINTVGRQEYMYEALAKAAAELNETVGRFIFSEHTIDYSDNEAVLVLSDWHYGMKADNIFNTFNTEICKQRVASVVEMAKERIALHRCKRLHIVLLGDFIHGAIHCSARVASEELVCDQLMQVSEILAQAIYELSQSVSEVVVHSTYGNHGRTVQKKKDSIHRDNMERVIPWWLRQRLSECENISIEEPEQNEFIIFNSCGHDFVCSHGDLDSVKDSPRLISALFHKTVGRDVEYVILGDKHHIESFNELGVTAEMCGSLCGADEYANEKRLFSDPSQLLLIVNEPCGVDAEYKLKLK